MFVIFALLISRDNTQTIQSKFECDIKINQSNKNNQILSITQIPFETYLNSNYAQNEIKKMNFGKPFIGLSSFSIEHILPCSIYLFLTKNSIIFYKLIRYIDQFKLFLKNKNYDKILNFIKKNWFNCY